MATAATCHLRRAWPHSARRARLRRTSALRDLVRETMTALAEYYEPEGTLAGVALAVNDVVSTVMMSDVVEIAPT